MDCIKGDEQKGTWAYELEYDAWNKTLSHFTRQKQEPSLNKSQGWHFGPAHDVRIDEFLRGDDATLFNVTKKLEDMFLSKS